MKKGNGKRDLRRYKMDWDKMGKKGEKKVGKFWRIQKRN